MFGQVGELPVFGLLGLSQQGASGAALQFFVMDVAKIFVLPVAVIIELEKATKIARIMAYGAISTVMHQ